MAGEQLTPEQEREIALGNINHEIMQFAMDRKVSQKLNEVGQDVGGSLKSMSEAKKILAEQMLLDMAEASCASYFKKMRQRFVNKS